MTTLWKPVFLCAPAHRLLMSLASTIRAKNLEFWFLPKDAMSKKILFPVGGSGLEPGLLRAVAIAVAPVETPVVIEEQAPVVVPVETPPEIYVAPHRPRKQDRN